MVTVTPLERAVGFAVSEKTYDLLNFTEQLMVDLKIEGFEDITIAQLFGWDARMVVKTMRSIRTKLAMSELKFHLEMKVYYKENQTTQLDESVFKDSFTTQNLMEGTRAE